MSTARTPSDDPHDELPVDARLIMPGTRYEVVEGEVVYVSPCDQPHGSLHSKLSSLLEAYSADGYDAACDMLTRTSEKNDFAPDGSIYPEAPHPVTSGRQLEELAFEVVSTETLAHAGRKAEQLVQRGVRRVFAIDVERRRGLEWSRATSGWEILRNDADIVDPALAAPLSVADLVGAAKTDDAVARALLAKQNRVLQAEIEAARDVAREDGRAQGRAEGKAQGTAEAVVAILVERGLAPDERRRAAILAERDARTLARWLSQALTCANASDLFEE